jgi:hypothetical protein
MGEDEEMRMRLIDRAFNWMAAFCVGYVLGVSIAAIIVFYWRT